MCKKLTALAIYFVSTLLQAYHIASIALFFTARAFFPNRLLICHIEHKEYSIVTLKWEILRTQILQTTFCLPIYLFYSSEISSMCLVLYDYYCYSIHTLLARTHQQFTPFHLFAIEIFMLFAICKDSTYFYFPRTAKCKSAVASWSAQCYFLRIHSSIFSWDSSIYCIMCSVVSYARAMIV